MRIPISLTFLVTALTLVLVPQVRGQSQAAAGGVVVAAAEGSPLEAATVTLGGTPLETPVDRVTGADGRFLFLRLVPGSYTLTVKRAGFRTGRYSIQLRPREVRDDVFSLALAPVSESIDVTAPTPLAATQAPDSTFLSRGRLDSLPLTQRTNLPEAILLSAPGMIRGHDDFVHIRGEEIALNPFIDGVSFWENPHEAFSAGLGVDYIDSINVMTGGFPAEYGNRFGGVLDVVTKSGFSVPYHGSVTLGAGMALHHSAGLEFGGEAGRFAYYLNASGFSSARYLSPPEPNAMNDTGRGARIFARFDYTASRKDVLRATLMGDGANFEHPMTLRDAELRPNFHNFQRNRSESAILSWDRVQSARTTANVSLYQRHSRTLILPNDDPYGAKLDSRRTLDTLGVKTDWRRVQSVHTVKGGIDLVMLTPNEQLSYWSQPWIAFSELPQISEDHIHFLGPDQGPGVPRPVLLNQRRRGGQLSAYLQDKIRLTRKLTFGVGLRMDHYSLAVTATHFSPRVNLSYALRSGTLLFASYNHFFVPPPIENVLAASAGLTKWVEEIGRPIPPLQPFAENQFEGGVTQSIAGRARVTVTSYYRTSNHPVHSVLFPDTRYYTYANFSHGTAYGMEVQANVPRLVLPGISGYLNYALGRVWFRNPITAGFITEDDHLTENNRFLAPMDQTHTLTAGITYRNAPTRLWWGATAEYGSGTPGSHDVAAAASDNLHAPMVGICGERCPSHLTGNLSMGWDAIVSGDNTGLTFQLSIENLSNNVYLISKESTFTQGQYSAPRIVSGSVKFTF